MYASPVHHNILFKSEEEYNAALAILRQPVVMEGEPRGLFRRRDRYEVILAGVVGVSLGHGSGEGRYSIWFIHKTQNEQDDLHWAMIQEALSPLNPVYTDDGVEVVEFLGRLDS